MIDVLRHLPDLKYVVFSYTSDNPIFTRVPGKIRYFTRVTAMNKKQLWRSIFSILWCLLFINPATTPKKCLSSGTWRINYRSSIGSMYPSNPIHLKRLNVMLAFNLQPFFFLGLWSAVSKIRATKHWNKHSFIGNAYFYCALSCS